MSNGKDSIFPALQDLLRPCTMLNVLDKYYRHRARGSDNEVYELVPSTRGALSVTLAIWSRVP